MKDSKGEMIFIGDLVRFRYGYSSYQSYIFQGIVLQLNTLHNNSTIAVIYADGYCAIYADPSEHTVIQHCDK